jgi:hypothetical protein
MNLLLGDFSTKLGREDVSKSTIVNESLQETNQSVILLDVSTAEKKEDLIQQ